MQRPDDLTGEQSLAVATRAASVVLASGAGCGKTKVLTARYLAHLKAGDAEPGQLVAITFTERAAREMRKRIRAAIKAEWQSGDRDTWGRHLRALETAPVCTIHAFCGSVLRQHAIAAGLDPRFEVLEEVLSAQLRDDSLSDGLHALVTEVSPTGDDLRQLVVLYGWRAVNEAVVGLLAAPEPAAWMAWAERPADDVAAEWQAFAANELLPAYVRHLCVAAPKIANCLRLLRATPCVGPVMREGVARILDGLPRLHEAADLAAAVEELTEAAKVGKERAKAWPDEASYEAIRDAFAEFRADLPAKLSPFLEPAENVAEAAVVGQRFARVAAACAGAFARRKRAAGVVDFHDLLSLTRDLLRAKPAVCASLRRRYRFLLLDELQDTDPVQMEIVELLCGDALTRGKLFAVGDAKQSIYRFRGAEVRLFDSLRGRVPDDGRQHLTLNFRSRPGILTFVNELFADHIPNYEPLRPHREVKDDRPCVEFLWSAKGPKDSASDGRRTEADRIARRIAELVASGEAEPRQIVMLFRSMSSVGLYETALRTHGIDYYLVGGRAFFAQQEVYDLLNLLRALENPQDAVCLAGTLRSPFGGLSDEALYVLARHSGGLWAGLTDDATHERLPDDQRARVTRVKRWLTRWRDHKDRLPIAGLLNFVLADSGYDAALQFEFLGERKLANLWKLIDLARTFDRSGHVGLADFIHRLDDLVRSLPREEQAATLPEEADVVRLMTIHQAKGLEFPVVVLPDLGATTGGPIVPVARWDARLGCVARPPAEDEPPLFTDFGWRLWKSSEAMADWHEDLRTFYVACTRAEETLILSGAITDPVKPQNAALGLLAERFDLKTGASRGDGRILVHVAPPAGDVEPPPRREPRPAVPLTADDARRVQPIEVLPDADEREERQSPRERVARAVLSRWDFADADGWQHLLADALAGEPAARAKDSATVVRRWLERFAASPLRRALATADELHRDVEFIHADARGSLDVLFRVGVRWTLVAWDFGDVTLFGDADPRVAAQAAAASGLAGAGSLGLVRHHFAAGVD